MDTSTRLKVRHVDLATWLLARGRSAVTAAEAAELMGIRPELVRVRLHSRRMCQRAKGRDVFDPWLPITQLGVDPRVNAAAFEPRRPDGWTPRLAEQNLVRKINESAYNNDLAQLVSTVPAGFIPADAAETILEELIRSIDVWS